MLDPARPGNIRNMDQPVNSIFNLNEGAEVSQISHPAMHSGAYLIAVAQGVPGVLLHLFHAEADAPSLWIDAQHLYVDQIAGVYDLARVLDPFRPAHFGDMDQAFNTRLEFHEGTIIRNAGNAAVNACMQWEPLFHTFPWIRKQLLVSE